MPVLTMLKEGLVSGSHENKEEGARVLILVIGLSSAKTLTSGRVVMMIAGPLIRVLGDKYSWQVKVAVLEALVALVRKVLPPSCECIILCICYGTSLSSSFNLSLLPLPLSTPSLLPHPWSFLLGG